MCIRDRGVPDYTALAIPSFIRFLDGLTNLFDGKILLVTANLLHIGVKEDKICLLYTSVSSFRLLHSHGKAVGLFVFLFLVHRVLGVVQLAAPRQDMLQLLPAVADRFQVVPLSLIHI